MTSAPSTIIQWSRTNSSMPHGKPILKDDKISSRESHAIAPTIGPISVPMPPSTTISRMSPEAAQLIYEGDTKRVRLASRTPDRTHTSAERT